MQKLNDLSQSPSPLDPDGTLIAVSRTEPVELARRRHRAWRRAPTVEEARGRRERIAEVAASMARRSGEGRASGQTHRCRFEAGRDGFWLARWLSARDIEAHVIHRRVWRCCASIGAPRPIGSTPNCSNALFSAGCAASVITARWWRSQQSRTKMPSGPTASTRASSENKVGSSTE
jgi:hypothetical protein